MSKPIILVVSEDSRQRVQLARDVDRRFGLDYEVASAASGRDALDVLDDMASQSRTLALIFVSEALSDAIRVELLVRARHLHPGCRRVLVISRGNWSSQHPLIGAMALGQVDFHLYDPWQPVERILYPSVAEFLAAWNRLQESPVVPIRIVAPRNSTRAHEIRDILSRAAVPFWSFEPDSEDGRALLTEVGVDGSRLPVVAFYTGEVFINPSNADFVSTLGMKTTPGVESCDVIIVGAGPSGLAAAVYAASEGLQTMVLEPFVPGGQAGTSSLIRNYLGFQRGVSGDELVGRAVEQAWLFGVDFVLTQHAVGLHCNGHDRVVRITDGNEIAARAVILATGVSWRRLNVPALEERVGAGVFYGAAGVEAKATQGRDVFVVGAGNSAGQAALHLSRYASSVTMLVRRESLSASMSDYLVREIDAAANVVVRYGSEVVDVSGAGSLETITVLDRISNRASVFPAAAVFVMIGAEPHTDWLRETVQCDENGYLRTGRDILGEGGAVPSWPLTRAPLLLETSVPGVFAVGDVRRGSVKRVASAVGEGATAVQLVHAYLAELEDAHR